MLLNSELPNNRMRRMLRLALFLLVLIQVEGCYYMQAIRGHSDLMNRRRPLAEVIADTESPKLLRQKLELVDSARNFAVSELMLPDNESYRSYADLERDYVVWNVFAAPEFSLEPKRWCFPVAGCVAYRGYFAEQSARQYADRLSANGYDTIVGGVAAYSTLGRFSDPVLNTMMRWQDIDLVSTIFHELAHQKLYVKGDSGFNESFATAVAQIGKERWLRERGEVSEVGEVEGRLPLRRAMMQLVQLAREELVTLYALEIGADEKRARKLTILNKLSADAEFLVRDSGTNARNWLAAPLNNARLASLNLYEGQYDAFRIILDQCNDELECFYARAEALAELKQAARTDALNALSD